MQVSIRVESGDRKGTRFAIPTPQATIGRDPKCDVQVDDRDVSREHCVIYVEDVKVMLRDEESGNGTYVNKRRVRGELELHNGDMIQIGPELFAVELQTEFQPSGGDVSETVRKDVPVVDPDSMGTETQARVDDRLKKL